MVNNVKSKISYSFQGQKSPFNSFENKINQSNINKTNIQSNSNQNALGFMAGYTTAGAASLGLITTLTRPIGKILFNKPDIMTKDTVEKIATTMKKAAPKDFKYSYINPTKLGIFDNKLTAQIKYYNNNFLGKICQSKKAPPFIKKVASAINNSRLNQFISAGAAILPNAKYAYTTSKVPSLILHEIGHAINANSRYAKYVMKARILSPLLFLPVVLMAFSHNKEKKADSIFAKTRKLLNDNIGKVILLLNMPVLIDEFNASRNAIKHVTASKLLNPETLTKFKGKLGLAYLTYVIGTVSCMLAMKLGIKIKDKINARQAKS